MPRIAGNNERRVVFTPGNRHRAPGLRIVADGVENPAKREWLALGDGCCGRQAFDLRPEPAGVPVKEAPGFRERPALRHREHRRSCRPADAKRVVARPRMTPEVDRYDPVLRGDFELLLLGI